MNINIYIHMSMYIFIYEYVMYIIMKLYIYIFVTSDPLVVNQGKCFQILFPVSIQPPAKNSWSMGAAGTGPNGLGSKEQADPFGRRYLLVGVPETRAGCEGLMVVAGEDET